MKTYAPIIITAALTVGSLLGLNYLNKQNNNITLNTPGFCLQSTARPIIGHDEFITFKNGDYEVREYGAFHSKTSQELNGDRLVDRIREDSLNPFSSYPVSKLLLRENDYEHNKETFDAADARLQDYLNR